MGFWNPQHDLNDEVTALREELLTPYDEAARYQEAASLHAFTDCRRTLYQDNQKNQGSCSAHGSTTAFEKLIWCKTGLIYPLSRQWMYISSQRKGGQRGDTGCSITHCVSIAKERGVPQERYQPYPKSYENRIAKEADAHAKYCKLEDAIKIQTPDQVYDFLRRPCRAIIIGIAWGGNLGEKGEFLKRFQPAKIRGQWPGHALCIPQISPETWEDSIPEVDLHNSHGTRFGKNGIKRIVPDALEEMLDHPMTRQFGGFIGVSGVKLTGDDFANPYHDGLTGM